LLVVVAAAAAEPSSGRPGRVAAKKEPVIDLSDSDDDKDMAKLVAKSSTSPQTKGVLQVCEHIIYHE
jgi:hypothetical protein